MPNIKVTLVFLAIVIMVATIQVHQVRVTPKRIHLGLTIVGKQRKRLLIFVNIFTFVFGIVSCNKTVHLGLESLYKAITAQGGGPM